MGSRDFTPAERRAIQRELSRQLGPEFISYRPHSGAKVAYLESWQAISMCAGHEASMQPRAFIDSAC